MLDIPLSYSAFASDPVDVSTPSARLDHPAGATEGIDGRRGSPDVLKAMIPAGFPSGSTLTCSGMNPRQFDLTPDRAGHLIALSA